MPYGIPQNNLHTMRGNMADGNTTRNRSMEQMNTRSGNPNMPFFNNAMPMPKPPMAGQLGGLQAPQGGINPQLAQQLAGSISDSSTQQPQGGIGPGWGTMGMSGFDMQAPQGGLNGYQAFMPQGAGNSFAQRFGIGQGLSPSNGDVMRNAMELQRRPQPMWGGRQNMPAFAPGSRV